MSNPLSSVTSLKFQEAVYANLRITFQLKENAILCLLFGLLKQFLTLWWTWRIFFLESWIGCHLDKFDWIIDNNLLQIIKLIYLIPQSSLLISFAFHAGPEIPKFIFLCPSLKRIKTTHIQSINDITSIPIRNAT